MTVEVWKSGDLTIEIDYEKCDGCGECVEACPADVYELVCPVKSKGDDKKAAAPNIAECIECCACVEACPKNAITHSSC